MNRKSLISALALLCSAVVSVQAQETMKNESVFHPIFPQGEKLPEQFSQYFIGQAYLAPLTQNSELGVPVSNVTFEPGCRNNWHSHTGGQLLICTAGRGFYQEQGCPARALRPGDVVEIAPDVVHWHGAAPDSWFSHLAVECNPRTNVNTWLDPVDDAQYRAATTDRSADAARNGEIRFSAAVADIRHSDPELSRLFEAFVEDEVLHYGDLDPKTRMLVTMASTIAQHAVGEYRTLLRSAWEGGITAVEIKETIYHAVPYVGIAKAIDFIDAANDFLSAHGVSLPLEGQASVSPETRYDAGLALQKSIFGEAIGRMADSMPDDQKHIARYLSANCFGDYQTRAGLDVRMRELLTFSILISLGGCESQVKGHIRGNANIGNDKSMLLAVVTQLLPYNGYPRTLNAIACLNEVLPEKE